MKPPRSQRGQKLLMDVVGVGVMQMNSYLRLDAVQAAAPKHVAPSQLHLSVVNLIPVLHLLQLFFRDLLPLSAMSCCLQELQPAGGDAGDQLRGRSRTIETNTVKSETV